METKSKLSKLANAFLKLRTSEEISALLADLLTKSEQNTLATRLKVAEMLEQGAPYTQIARETGASSATIAKVSENFKYGSDGYKLVLERLNKAR